MGSAGGALGGLLGELCDELADGRGQLGAARRSVTGSLSC